MMDTLRTNTTSENSTSQSGFTLVEMAIAMIIVGFLIAFAVSGFSSILSRDAEKKTFSDMELIADAISIYAQKHMRVPCPADPTGSGAEPFGTEVNSGANGTNFGSCDETEAEGIIPFATLGIPQHFIRDRFGNYITYRVSLTSAQNPSTASTQLINNWCMTRPHWHKDTIDNDKIPPGPGQDGMTDEYVSLPKAAFCCGTWRVAAPIGTLGDIDIFGSFNTTLPHLSRGIAGAGGNISEYRLATANPPTYAELAIPSVPPSFPAYILVSHGENGAGAYSSDLGVRNTAGMADPELENVNNDVKFFAPDRLASVNPVGAGNQQLFYPDIDDIVFWATPSQTLGRIGGVSCNAP